MNMKKILFWAPRVLCILFAFFISLFAFDVFDGGRSFWESALAFLIHLIPTFAIIAVLIVAWKREWIGAILCFALALLYVIWAWGRFEWYAYFLISGPLVVISILFLMNWIHRVKARPEISIPGSDSP
jgi:uncharacterized membrane protein (GlpM family)